MESPVATSRYLLVLLLVFLIGLPWAVERQRWWCIPVFCFCIRETSSVSKTSLLATESTKLSNNYYLQDQLASSYICNLLHLFLSKASRPTHSIFETTVLSLLTFCFWVLAPSSFWMTTLYFMWLNCCLQNNCTDDRSNSGNIILFILYVNVGARIHFQTAVDLAPLCTMICPKSRSLSQTGGLDYMDIWATASICKKAYAFLLKTVDR